MQMILGILCLFLVQTAFAHEAPKDDKPTKEVYRIAKKFGYTSRSEINQAYKEAKKNLNVDKIQNELKLSFKDRYETARKADEALDALLRRADSVLRNTGNDKLADEIFIEYEMYYRGHYQITALGMKEMGDHEPWSEWIEKLHLKIEDAIGEVKKFAHHFADGVFYL